MQLYVNSNMQYWRRHFVANDTLPPLVRSMLTARCDAITSDNAYCRTGDNETVGGCGREFDTDERTYIGSHGADAHHVDTSARWAI